MTTATTDPNPDPASTLSYLLDANVLIALTNPSHLHHARTRAWFDGVRAWATTPLTESAFVRLMLNPAVAGRETSAAEVCGVLRGLRGLPGHAFVVDDVTWADTLIDLSGLIGHRQVSDLHLIELAARSGYVLATLDARITGTLVPEDRRHVAVI